MGELAVGVPVECHAGSANACNHELHNGVDLREVGSRAVLIGGGGMAPSQRYGPPLTFQRKFLQSVIGHLGQKFSGKMLVYAKNRISEHMTDNLFSAVTPQWRPLVLRHPRQGGDAITATGWVGFQNVVSGHW